MNSYQDQSAPVRYKYKRSVFWRILASLPARICWAVAGYLVALWIALFNFRRPVEVFLVGSIALLVVAVDRYWIWVSAKAFDKQRASDEEELLVAAAPALAGKAAKTIRDLHKIQ